MTDRFALAYADAWRVGSRGGADQGHLRRGGQGCRRHRRGRVGTDVAPPSFELPLHGPLPLPRGADAELFGRPRGQALLLLRLREGRRRRPFRPGDRERRLRRRDRVARRAVPRATRVRGDVTAPGCGAPAPGAATALLDQAASYFERVLWETEAGEPVRDYLSERGLGEEIAKEFRLGLSRGSGLVAKARESGFSPRRSAPRGSRTSAATTTSPSA